MFRKVGLEQRIVAQRAKREHNHCARQGFVSQLGLYDSNFASFILAMALVPNTL